MSNEPENDPLEAVLHGLRNEQVTVRQQAIQKLQQQSWAVGGDSGLEGLSDDEIIKALGERRTQWLQQSRIVEALLLAIDDSSVRVRSTTALMLGNIVDLRAQEALVRHLRNDPERHTRRMCVAALDWTPASSQKVEGFIDALKDSDSGIAFVACASLGRAGDVRAIEPLRTAMTNLAWNVQFHACEALVKLRAVDRAVVKLLERLNRAPEAKEHNKMSAEIAEQFPRPGKDPNEHTTSGVLAQARRLLPP